MIYDQEDTPSSKIDGSIRIEQPDGLMGDGSAQKEMIGATSLALRDQIASIARIFSSIQNSYSAPILQASENLQEISRNFSLMIFDQIRNFELSFFDTLRPFFERAKELNDYVDAVLEQVDTFNALSWPIAPSMSWDLRTKVVELYRQKKQRSIPYTIRGYYHKNDYSQLKLAVNSWSHNPLFVHRHLYIRESFTAHQQKKYCLTVPSLLTHIEGVINKYSTHRSSSHHLGRGDLFPKVVGNPEQLEVEIFPYIDTALHFWEKLYEYISFETELDKPPRMRKVTRHTVLHGVNTNYGTCTQSLKLFCMLDAVSSLGNIIV